MKHHQELRTLVRLSSDEKSHCSPSKEARRLLLLNKSTPASFFFFFSSAHEKEHSESLGQFWARAERRVDAEHGVTPRSDALFSFTLRQLPDWLNITEKSGALRVFIYFVFWGFLGVYFLNVLSKQQPPSSPHLCPLLSGSFYIYIFLSRFTSQNQRRRACWAPPPLWFDGSCLGPCREWAVSSGRLQKSVKCAHRAPLISDKCARLSGKEALTQIASSFELKPQTLAPHKAPSVRRAQHQCFVCLPVWFARLVFILWTTLSFFPASFRSWNFLMDPPPLKLFSLPQKHVAKDVIGRERTLEWIMLQENLSARSKLYFWPSVWANSGHSVVSEWKLCKCNPLQKVWSTSRFISLWKSANGKFGHRRSTWRGHKLTSDKRFVVFAESVSQSVTVQSWKFSIYFNSCWWF